MAIGPTLQAARLKKQLTTSQVAELTRMKVQIVDDLEHDDFHRVAATIYGKGFIKLFAECVELEPMPLIADYMRSVQGGGTPSACAPDGDTSDGDDIRHVPVAHAPAVPEPEPRPEDLFDFASSRRKRITPAAPHSRPSDSGAAPRHPEPSASIEKHRTHSEREPFSAVVTKVVNRMRGRGQILAETVRDRLAGLKWSERFLKALGIALAAAALILVLIPVVRHLAVRSGSRPPADNELILFTPVPEPYID